MPQFVDLRDRYTVLLESLEVSPGHRAAVEQRATAIVVAQRRYEKVSETTRIPWFVIAALHSVVTNLNFKAHLHNGDPLSARTVHEPRDRPLGGAPPFSWEQSAIDALRFGKVGRSFSNDPYGWTFERIAYEIEAFTGWGYWKHGIPSPCLWGGTNHYHSGEFTDTGHFIPTLVSKTIGAMALLPAVLRRAYPRISLGHISGKLDDAYLHPVPLAPSIELERISPLSLPN